MFTKKTNLALIFIVLVVIYLNAAWIDNLPGR
jgi:hypothetical protein